MGKAESHGIHWSNLSIRGSRFLALARMAGELVLVTDSFSGEPLLRDAWAFSQHGGSFQKSQKIRVPGGSYITEYDLISIDVVTFLHLLSFKAVTSLVQVPGVRLCILPHDWAWNKKMGDCFPKNNHNTIGYSAAVLSSVQHLSLCLFAWHFLHLARLWTEPGLSTGLKTLESWHFYGQSQPSGFPHIPFMLFGVFKADTWRQ